MFRAMFGLLQLLFCGPQGLPEFCDLALEQALPLGGQVDFIFFDDPDEAFVFNP